MANKEIVEALSSGLNELLSCGAERLEFNEQTIQTLREFASVSKIVSDSADTLVETTPDPSQREKIAEFSNIIRTKTNNLFVALAAVPENPQNPALKEFVVECAKDICTAITNLLNLDEDADEKRIIDGARECALRAKYFMEAAFGDSKEAMRHASVELAERSLALVRTLQEVAKKYENNDTTHFRKLEGAVSRVKQTSTGLLQAGKAVFESTPEESEERTQQSAVLHKAVSDAAAALSYCIGVSKPDNTPAMVVKPDDQPVIPEGSPEVKKFARMSINSMRNIKDISAWSDTSAIRTRPLRKTVCDSGVSKAVLHRAKKATIGASIGLMLAEEFKKLLLHDHPTPPPSPSAGVAAADGEVAALRRRLETVERENRELREENEALKGQLLRLKAVAESLKKLNNELTAQLVT